jgi:hypothetical protein
MIHIKITNKFGLILRLKSFWIGVHHSDLCGRTCINILPCVTIYIGNSPTKM